jgi:hypothetical protein
VGTADQAAARELMAGLPGVLAVEPSGARLHVFITPQGNPEAVRQKLSDGGLQASEFERITPSLEDVFIDLVRRSGGGDGN